MLQFLYFKSEDNPTLSQSYWDNCIHNDTGSAHNTQCSASVSCFLSLLLSNFLFLVIGLSLVPVWTIISQLLCTTLFSCFAFGCSHSTSCTYQSFCLHCSYLLIKSCLYLQTNGSQLIVRFCGVCPFSPLHPLRLLHQTSDNVWGHFWLS